MKPEVEIYDTTLRDGSQGEGINFSALDKLLIAEKLDAFGIHFIEGGWPGANPTDDAFFTDAPVLTRARFAAFGMTRRLGRSAANDPQLSALLNANTAGVCIVGKASAVQVRHALGITLDENLTVIADTIGKAVTASRPRTRYAVGYGAKPIIFLHGVLPDRGFDAFIRRATGVPS